MELEQKVQALEQELQILKNQIQATLLDIQEQVLTNAHPSLRADDALPSGGGGGGSNSLRSDSRDEPASNVRKVSLDQVRIIEADDESDEDDEMVMPPARQKPAPRKAARQPVAARPQPPQADWDTLAEMEQWVSRKVGEMGASRTRKLIAMYAQQGRFTEGEREALMEYVAIFDDDPETELARPARKPGGSSQRQPAPPPNGRQSSPVRQTPAALPQPAAARPQPASGNGRPQTSTRTQPAVRPQQPARPAARQPEIPKQDGNTSLVLKLIAGVQNAGAGVKWKKNNG